MGVKVPFLKAPAARLISAAAMAGLKRVSIREHNDHQDIRISVLDTYWPCA